MPDIVGITGAGPTLLEIMECAARCAAAGWKGLIGSGSTTVRLHDPELIDNQYDTTSWGSLYVYRPEAADADKRRRLLIEPYLPGEGTLAIPIERAWNPAPAVGEPYYVFGIVPPYPMAGVAYSWRQAVNDGLRSEAYLDEVSLGAGDNYGKFEFDVSTPYPSVRSIDRVRKVRVRRDVDAPNGIYGYQDANTGGRWAERRLDRGIVKVLMHPPPGASETVLVEIERRYIEDTELTTDAETVENCSLALACATTRIQLFQTLNGQSATAGRFTAEANAAMVDWEDNRMPIPPAIWGF